MWTLKAAFTRQGIWSAKGNRARAWWPGPSLFVQLGQVHGDGAIEAFWASPLLTCIRGICAVYVHRSAPASGPPVPSICRLFPEAFAFEAIFGGDKGVPYINEWNKKEPLHKKPSGISKPWGWLLPTRNWIQRPPPHMICLAHTKGTCQGQPALFGVIHMWLCSGLGCGPHPAWSSATEMSQSLGYFASRDPDKFVVFVCGFPAKVHPSKNRSQPPEIQRQQGKKRAVWF